MTVRSRTRHLLFGPRSHVLSWAALALVIAGVLFLLVEAQSASKLYWTGRAVAGTNSGGIVFYDVKGVQYTVDAPGPAPKTDEPVTVYVDPSDPSHALIDRPTRWIDAGTVLVWFVAAAVCLGAGVVRQVRQDRARRTAGAPDAFGSGFTAEEIDHYLGSRQTGPSRHRAGHRDA